MVKTLMSTNANQSRSPSLIDGLQSKPIKTPAHLRKAQILALQTAGWTQERIAQHFGVSRSTIITDLQDLQPARDQVEAALSKLVSALDTLQTVEDVALNYVELAQEAHNEAVRLGAQQRIDDLRGIVTEKERIRAKQSEVIANQPMFVLPAGAQVSVTVNQVQPAVRDITPEDGSGHGNGE